VTHEELEKGVSVKFHGTETFEPALVDQRALDNNYKPIPGLYVSGNCCGRRFGQDYVTPTSGVSLGIAICLGRECGKSICADLDEGRI
jgi:predicted oxidoreductase